jgi:hypothetical protein
MMMCSVASATAKQHVAIVVVVEEAIEGFK